MMKKNNDRLDALLDKFDKNQLNHNRNEQQEYNDRDEFISLFVQKRDNIIKPYLESVVERLNARGHDSSVKIIEHTENAEPHHTHAKIALNVRPKGFDNLLGIDKQETPCIEFVPDVRKKNIIVHQKTLDSSGYCGETSAYDINEKFVSSQVDEWLERMLSETSRKRGQDIQYML